MQADSNLLYGSPDWRETLKSFDHIEDNNIKLAMKPYPSVKLLADFAELVYSDCSDFLAFHPLGWYLLTTARNSKVINGYFGCAVWSPSQHQIVIAHRGTDIKNFGALYADVQSVYRNNYTGHMNSAVSFADEVKREIIKVNKEHGSCFVLSFTGHSLGAWLAGVTTFTVKYLKMEGDGFRGIDSPEEGLHAHTLALDSPGIEDILIKICRKYGAKYDQSKCSKYLDITNFFAAPNAVNCTGYQVGNILQIHIERVAKSSELNLWNRLIRKIWTPNIDTHGVHNFITAFKERRDTYEVENWPQGWSERKYYHREEMFCNSYLLIPDAIQPPPESSSGSHQNIQPVTGNAGSEPILQYSIIKSMGTICQLGVFSTEEFNFIQNWNFFHRNVLVKRTEIENFVLCQKLNLKIDLPTFKIDLRRNTITCDSKENLEKVIGQTKQLLRWFPEIKEAMDLQIRSIESAPLYMAGLIYLDTLPIILDCEDTLGLESFLESSKSVLQILVTGDFEFQAARLYNILFRMENTTLDIKYLDEKYHTILSWNDVTNLAKVVDFQGLSETDVNISNLIILVIDSAENITSQLKPFLKNLEKFSHKKLVIIKSQEIGENLFNNYNLTFETKSSEIFGLKDLTSLSRQKTFSRDAITIGEETLSLEILLGNDCKTPNDKINQLIAPFLKNLVTDDPCIEKIPNNLPRLFQLDALYSRGNKVVDRARLIALLERSGASGPQLVISDPDMLSLDYWGEARESTRARIFTTNEDGWKLFMEKCREELDLTIYWFHLSAKGFTLNEVHNRSVYLPRRFNSRLIIKSINEFVQYKGDKDLFIFNNVEDKASLIQTFGLSGKAEDVFKKNDHFIIRSHSQELSAEDKKKEDSFSKHYFEMEIRGNPCLVWKYSKGSLDGLRPFITRDNRDTIKEKDFCIMKKKHTIIADDPGMGKTTTLTRMSELIPNTWVLRIDHKLLADSFKKLPQRLDINSVIKFLIHASSLPTDKQIVSDLLEHCLRSDNSRKVCVLVDAFDEIFDQNKVKMAELLKYLKTATTCQIVVTTRKYQQKWLENNLEEFAVELTKITEKEQEHYLVNFWLPHLALELPDHGKLEKERLFQFARELREEMVGVLGKDVASFMGIPLQIRMLAEVFLKQVILNAISPEQVNNLSKITNLFDLYKQFIEVKKNIYFEQKTNINELPPTHQKAMFKDTMEKHCVLAFQTIDPTFATEYFTNIKLSDLTTDEVKDISCLGLIKFKTDGTFHFVHRTFLEYFCADFFVRWLRHGKNSKEENILIKNEFCKFLLKPDYKIIRMFIETQLETKPIYGEELENHPKMYQHWSEYRQLFFDNHKKTPLHIAAEEQNTRIVGVLLSGPPSRTSDESYISLITPRDKDGRTALKIALEKGNTNTVNKITENVRSCMYESIVGLMLATFLAKEEYKFNGDDEKNDNCNDNDNGNDDNYVSQRFYFEQYFNNTWHLADVNQAMKRTRHIRDIIFAPFIAAVRRDDYETVLKIFSDLESDTERANILIATDGQGDTAINLATSKQNHTLFKLFAKQGVCVSYDKYKKTPLYRAAIRGYFKIVNFLLNQSEETYEDINHGLFGKEKIFDKSDNVTLKFENNSSLNSLEMLAHINSADNYNNTCLLSAADIGHHEVTRILLRSGADINYVGYFGHTALINAANNGHHEVTRILLEFRADINSVNNDGNTALMGAARNGHHEVARMLLESGADINTANNLGNTVMMFATLKKNHELISMLLTSGANLNSANKDGNTALIMAAYNGDPEAIRILLESGADINSADIGGNTALMRAAFYGYHEVTRILLKSGADPNSANSDGITTLMRAAYNGHHKVTRMLLKSGADTNSANSDGITALMYAAQKGHHEVIRTLLDSGADSNYADSGGNTALIKAAYNGYQKVTGMLLESGADIKSANINSYTALMYAAQNGHHEVTRMLLESGVDINSANINSYTALMYAAQNGHHEVTRMLLKFGADANSSYGGGNTALMRAAYNGHQEVTRILLESRVDTNSADRYGYTALMYAAWGGHHEVICMLLESRADTNLANRDGNTALMYAAWGGHHEVICMLLVFRADTNLANRDGNTALIFAAQEGHREVTCMLLERGANINSADNYGNTALMHATRNKRHEVIRTLLESGADINSANSDGITAMMMAAKNGHHEVTRMLLDSGADINTADGGGNTAMMMATGNGHHEVTRMLLESVADINSANSNGDTAMLMAARYGHHEVIRTLLESGADINSANSDGITAMMMAAKNGHHEVTRMLLESEADINSANSNGDTAMLMAARYGHHEVIRLLLKSGADINNSDGITAMMIAARYGHHEVTHTLLEFYVDANSVNPDCKTALMIAAQHGHHEVTRMLLESGAEINHQNISGGTAISEAAFYGHVNIVELLLQYNADISLQDQNGRTALYRAQERGHQEIVDLLRGHMEALPAGHL